MTAGSARECAAFFGVVGFECARRSPKGRIRRNPAMRLGQIALAVALIIVVELIDWRKPPPSHLEAIGARSYAARDRCCRACAASEATEGRGSAASTARVSALLFGWHTTA